MSMPAETDDDGPLYAPAPKVYPQSIAGRFRRIKTSLLIVCLGIYYILPFIRWNRGPNLPDQAVLIDFERKRLYFFFIELWPQEVYYLTGLLILAALTLFLMNAVAGRLWCGYLCPQTVWTDLFLKVERAIEGDRRERIKRDGLAWTLDTWARKITKHFLWLMIAWWTGGAWVLYFNDAPTLVRALTYFQAPVAAYAWIGILTFTTYSLAGHLREQVCLYMCPWPRIQAALTDADALNVAYRYDRGEPRMAVKRVALEHAAGRPAGDCIDCNQCVAVCPTGVDIRDGAQLGCIQCGLCIDACDQVMTKVGRATGLIGYDTEAAIAARACQAIPPKRRIVRVRTVLYAAIIALVGSAMLYQLATRQVLSVNVVHERTPLYTTLRDGSIRNAYTLRLANKQPEERFVAISLQDLSGADLTVAGAATTHGDPVVLVPADSTLEVRAFVSVHRRDLSAASQPITFIVTDVTAKTTARVRDNFFGP